MKVKVMLLSLIIGFLLLFSMEPFYFVHGDSEEIFHEKRVLFISSYSPSFPTYFNQIDGLNDAFEAYPVVLDIEFMDSKRFYTAENIDNFKTSLTYKLNQTTYDLVITSDDNAIAFVMEHKDQMFVDLPIVFFGINNETNARTYSLEENVTGVVEATSMEETIRLAVTLNQNASKVVALVDDTVTGQSELSQFYKLNDAFPNHIFSEINLSQMELSDFSDRVSDIDEDSVVLLISALRGIDATSYEFEDTNTLILNHANQPVYHLYEFGIDAGLIGGKVVSHYVQGQTAANMVLRYFNGEDFESLELIEDSPNRYVINYEVFERFHYDKSLIPEDTYIMNKKLTLYEEYGVYFLLAILFIILQSGIIGALIISVRNRNKARLEVVEINQFLEKANDELAYKSYHDELTGLFNRNYFEEQYPRLDRLLKDVPISIIVIDVNGLKLINDAFGHISGDKVLIQTSNALLDTFSNSDIFRIGGDEFAIIPYGKTEETVMELLKELSAKVKEIQIEGIKVSVSTGYAFKDDTKTLNEMFTEAEDWMYREKLSDVPSTRTETIDAIIATINQKDIYSEEHSKRVSELSVKIASYMNLSDNMINEIKTAGLLHDIGKIIVPTHILNKPSKLTNEEYNEIKKHSEIGYRILNSVSSMRDIARYVFCHHEQVDGKGYPRGLKGDEIPIQSKIIGIADALDAMLTDRLYRKRLTKEACKEELIKYQGTQFFEEGVLATINNFDDIVSIFETENDDKKTS